MKSPDDFQVSELPPRPSSQVDNALHFIHNQEYVLDLSLSSNAEKELLRKIDWKLLLLMAAMYNLQYLDKTIRTVPPRFVSVLLLCE